MDGLVYPDRTPHTGLLEYKNVYRPVRIVSYDQENGQMVLHNYMDFDEILPFANEMPPTYLITSSGDTLAKKQTIQLYELLKKNGVSCELANYGKEYGETLPHVFSVLQPFEPAGKDAIDKALAFYQNEMKQGVN